MRVSVLLMIGVCVFVFSAYVAHQTKLKLDLLEQEVQGMSEYEVCQYATKNFEMAMVKDMGCLDGN